MDGRAAQLRALLTCYTRELEPRWTEVLLTPGARTESQRPVQYTRITKYSTSTPLGGRRKKSDPSSKTPPKQHLKCIPRDPT